MYSARCLYLVVDFFKIWFLFYFLHGFAAIIIIATLQGHILHLIMLNLCLCQTVLVMHYFGDIIAPLK